MKQIEGTSLLVTIAEDLLNEPTLKVWALDKLEKKTGLPTCLSTVSVQNGRRQFPVRFFFFLIKFARNNARYLLRGWIWRYRYQPLRS